MEGGIKGRAFSPWGTHSCRILVIQGGWNWRVCKRHNELGLPGGQWLRTCPFTAGSVGSIPSQGTEIPHASWGWWWLFSRKVVSFGDPIDCSPTRLLMSTGLSSQECWRGLPCKDRVLMRNGKRDRQSQRRNQVDTEAETGGRRGGRTIDPQNASFRTHPWKTTCDRSFLFSSFIA